MNSNPILSAYTALALKVVAVILIVSSLIDYIILAIPFKPLDQAWQIGFTNQIVDRGIVPLVGIVFLVIGYWIGEASDTAEEKPIFLDLRLYAFIIASILGLLFLLLVPLHVSNLSRAIGDQIQQIDEQANAAEAQIGQQSDQLDLILRDEARLNQLNQAIESGEAEGQQLQPAQIEQLKQLRDQIRTLQDNPQALSDRIEQAQTQVRERKLELEQQARTNAVKSGVRIGISSLLLALGYSALGWMGFKGLGSATSRRRPSLR
ncbi:MAG: HpsJ family protein [Cyanobacteriota bacterium]|nr:HpsJ family protein [Cyanobacteriota bacterium]